MRAQLYKAFYKRPSLLHCVEIQSILPVIHGTPVTILKNHFIVNILNVSTQLEWDYLEKIVYLHNVSEYDNSYPKFMFFVYVND